MPPCAVIVVSGKSDTAISQNGRHLAGFSAAAWICELFSPVLRLADASRCLARSLLLKKVTLIACYILRNSLSDFITSCFSCEWLTKNIRACDAFRNLLADSLQKGSR